MKKIGTCISRADAGFQKEGGGGGGREVHSAGLIERYKDRKNGALGAQPPIYMGI